MKICNGEFSLHVSKDGTFKSDCLIISLKNICFCMPMGKLLKKSEIAWFLTARTLQLRCRDNTCMYLEIINGK